MGPPAPLDRTGPKLVHSNIKKGPCSALWKRISQCGTLANNHIAIMGISMRGLTPHCLCGRRRLNANDSH